MKAKAHGTKIFDCVAMWLLVVMVCSLTACNGDTPRDSQPVEVDSTDLVYADGRVSGTLYEGITVDAKIPDLSEVQSYDIVSAHLQLPEDAVLQSLKDYIFRDYAPDEIRTEYLEDTQHTNFYVGEDDRWTHPWMTTIAHPGFQSVSIGDGDAWLSGGQYVTPARTLGSSVLTLFTKQELGFMPRAEAVKSVEAQLAAWSIQPIGEPEVYCLDHETLTQHERLVTAQEQEEFNPALGDKLDCYLMVFDVGYNKIPYSFYEFRSAVPQSQTYEARLHVYLTAEGIVYMDYSWADYAITGVLEKHDSAITLDQAMVQAKKRYEEFLITSDIFIPKIYLQYVATLDGQSIGQEAQTGNCILVPAWVIQPATEMQNEPFYLDPILIHAITGGDITYSGKYS